MVIVVPKLGIDKYEFYHPKNIKDLIEHVVINYHKLGNTLEITILDAEGNMYIMESYIKDCGTWLSKIDKSLWNKIVKLSSSIKVIIRTI